MKTDYLKDAKELIDHYRKPMPDDDWPYTYQYAKLSVLISIAESLKKLTTSTTNGNTSCNQKVGDKK